MSRNKAKAISPITTPVANETILSGDLMKNDGSDNADKAYKILTDSWTDMTESGETFIGGRTIQTIETPGTLSSETHQFFSTTD